MTPQPQLMIRVTRAQLALLHASAEIDALNKAVRGRHTSTLAYECRKSISEAQQALREAAAVEGYPS